MAKTATQMNWKLTIEYDGARYYGWQEQPGAACCLLTLCC